MFGIFQDGIRCTTTIYVPNVRRDINHVWFSMWGSYRQVQPALGGGFGNAQGAAPPARPRLHWLGFTATLAYRIRPVQQKRSINPPRPATGSRKSNPNPACSNSTVQRPGDLASMTTRRRRRRQQGGGLPGVCESAWRPALELRPAWRRAAAGRDLRVGLEAGPGTAARLEAGSCGEGFASLFQGRPYSRIRSALAVPCFSAAGCPRRVCRNPHSVCGLFWTLLPVLTCTV